jgi:membrane-bound ClpP family serine protease
VEELFAWYNLIFYIPILISIILVFSAAGFGADADIDADTPDVEFDADAEAEVDGDVDEVPIILRALSIIGIGRCPLSVVLLTAFLIFGGTGLILNQIFAPFLAFVSVIGAFFSMLFFTRIIAIGISKLMPGTETYVVTNDHLVGLAGELIMKTSTQFGMAHVYDHHGGLHKIQCKTYKGELPSGTHVLIVDRKEDVFLVEKDPQF